MTSIKLSATDSRFLTVHPATAAWWQRREQCQRCTHRYMANADSEDYREPRCAAAPAAPKPGRHRVEHDRCVDARATAAERDDGRAGACGPEAILFTPIKVPT